MEPIITQSQLNVYSGDPAKILSALDVRYPRLRSRVTDNDIKRIVTTSAAMAIRAIQRDQLINHLDLMEDVWESYFDDDGVFAMANDRDGVSHRP